MEPTPAADTVIEIAQAALGESAVVAGVCPGRFWEAEIGNNQQNQFVFRDSIR
jgi:hypothetical protein